MVTKEQGKLVGEASMRAALKMAIEALELCDGNGLKDYDFCIAIHKCKTALNACKEALDTDLFRECSNHIDAQRYRWLKNRAYLNNKGWIFEHIKYREKPTTIDEAIDKAMGIGE